MLPWWSQVFGATWPQPTPGQQRCSSSCYKYSPSAVTKKTNTTRQLPYWRRSAANPRGLWRSCKFVAGGVVW